MTSTDAIAAKNAFVLITNKFVIKTNAFFHDPCCHEFNNWFRGESSQPRCVVGPRVSPAYFKLTAWIAANVYAYVHGHTRTRVGHPLIFMRISSKTLSTSSLTINAPLIVKDEVDKVFRTSFHNKTKILCGLKAYCYLGPACPGALEGPRTGGSMITILIE